MIKFEHTEVLGWEHAIRGMQNPMNSWEKSDSRNNIITLCGSSRFKDEYLKVQKELSLKGYLVLSLGLFGHSGDDEAWAKKDLLDRVHLQKIDMSSAIFVIDVDGYVGETTKSEIEYAISRGKTVYFYSRNDLDKVREIPNGSLRQMKENRRSPFEQKSEAVTKEQCEASLGSIFDAIEEYCLAVNKDVYGKLEKAQDVINQLIEEHEELQKAHKKLLSLWGKDLTTWRDETSQLLQDAGFEDASKYLDAVWEL